MPHLIQLLPSEEECRVLREALSDYCIKNPDSYPAWKLLSTLTTKVLEANNRA